jgi:hypothetical protein
MQESIIDTIFSIHTLGERRFMLHVLSTSFYMVGNTLMVWGCRWGALLCN